MRMIRSRVLPGRRAAGRGARSRRSASWVPRPGRPLLAWTPLVLGSPLGQDAPQDADCRLHGVGAYSRSVRISGSDNYRHHGSGGIDYRCDDGVRIRGDSAVVFEADNQIHLFGSVRFADRSSELEADSAFYFGADKQLRAWGDIRVEDHASGAIITGQTLNYFRGSAIRALDRLDVYEGRPHATVRPPRPLQPGGARADPDSARAGASGEAAAEDPEASAAVPYEIDADHFVLEGRRFFRARDNVVVVRDSIRITGDTLVYDLEGGLMTVSGNARVEEQDFVLTAPSLTARPAGRGDVVLARGGAQLTGRSMLMLAPAIRVFLAGGAADRLLALSRVPASEPVSALSPDDMVGLSPGDQARLRSLVQRDADADASAAPPVQPSVSTTAFNLWADSIEVVAPAQALDVVNAVGAARAETLSNQAAADWNAPEVAAKDWMKGDTIIARFAPGEPAAPGEPPSARLETLTASGGATSFYRLAPSDTLESAGAAPSPALHYVAGDRITVLLEGGEVVQMDVEGATVGHHWEPAPPVADTAAPPPDTTGRGGAAPALAGRRPWT